MNRPWIGQIPVLEVLEGRWVVVFAVVVELAPVLAVVPASEPVAFVVVAAFASGN